MSFKGAGLVLCTALLLPACSTNPATGKTQFAALMSPDQEIQVGAQEHEKIVAQFGLFEDPALNNYVRDIGARVSAKTERPDIEYKFFIIDSPIVNAFALPGGYVYISRGLLALANSEAEIAGVLGHEIGHITGRHSAERYSHGVISNIGATVLSIALDSDSAAKALGLGANLYLSSYSRSQESEADSLGLRYMHLGGYDTAAMPSFLRSLQRYSELEAQIEGQENNAQFNYFATHPATSERVQKTASEASGAYPPGGDMIRDPYLQQIDGLVFGDSASQGFVRNGRFYHPEIGFSFEVVDGMNVKNQPDKITIISEDKQTLAIFDMASTSAVHTPETYLRHIWMKDQDIGTVDAQIVNDMNTVHARFDGSVNNRAVDIHIYAVQWSDKRFARFQIAVPRGSSIRAVEPIVTSFRKLDAVEKRSLEPDHVQVITALANDSVATLAPRQSFEKFAKERFMILNALEQEADIKTGRPYKLVVSP